MSEYAKGTSVPVIKTRMEIEEMLVRFEAKSSAVATEPGSASVMFQAYNRWVKFRMPLPTKPDRAEGMALRRHEQVLRERWRALLLVLKSKFVSLDTGVETFEQAFLAHIVGANGRTVGESMLPELEALYKGNNRPQLGSGAP